MIAKKVAKNHENAESIQKTMTSGWCYQIVQLQWSTNKIGNLLSLFDF